MNLDDLRAQRKRILEVAHLHGATHVRIFGSVARGHAGVKSDVDFLVSFEPGRSLLDHASLQLALETLLARRVDIASERGLKAKYRDRILREAVAL